MEDHILLHKQVVEHMDQGLSQGRRIQLVHHNLQDKLQTEIRYFHNNQQRLYLPPYAGPLVIINVSDNKPGPPKPNPKAAELSI